MSCVWNVEGFLSIQIIPLFLIFLCSLSTTLQKKIKYLHFLFLLRFPTTNQTVVHDTTLVHYTVISSVLSPLLWLCLLLIFSTFFLVLFTPLSLLLLKLSLTIYVILFLHYVEMWETLILNVCAYYTFNWKFFGCILMFCFDCC